MPREGELATNSTRAVDEEQAKGDEVNSSKFSHPRRKSHLARWWWVYLILSLIIGVAILVGLLFGLVPKIAQKSIDDSTIQVHGIAIRDPTNNQITLDMNSTVQASVPVAATLSPQAFQMFSLQSGSNPFLSMPVDDFKVENTFDLNVVGASSQILDANAYESFATQIVSQRNIQVGLVSTPDISIGPLKYRVNFQKSIQLQGLNMLQGMTLSNSTILKTPMPDGTNMLNDCTIPNPSSFKMELGNLTADIYLGPAKIGFTTIKDLTLYPGDNKIQVFNHLNPLLVASPTITNAFLSIPNINITLMFTSVIFDGQSIGWLQQPLQKLSPFFATMNPGPSGGPKLPISLDQIEAMLARILNGSSGTKNTASNGGGNPVANATLAVSEPLTNNAVKEKARETGQAPQVAQHQASYGPRDIAGDIANTVGAVAGNIGNTVGAVAGRIGGTQPGTIGNTVGRVAGDTAGAVTSVAGSVGRIIEDLQGLGRA
ncbi:hypothetical protein TWF694_005288 [Orbilia ellipsospora]|uniref:Uncharacterized protein n=1 Tax=Orbilia ellipsospora TaxID=2528407 RepID=A0AAV9WSM9_9PEZI